MSGAEEEIASALSLPVFPSVEQQKREIEQRMQALYAGEIAIPADVVDEVLRRGGNKSRSRLRIIYNFMIEQTPEEYTEFIRKEYGTGGIGMEIAGTKYSVWHDGLGMQIAAGYTVSGNILEKVFLSWEDVGGRIYQLLKQGEYAPQPVLDAARANALKEHAAVLAYLERDMADGISEIVFQDQDTFRGGFPDVVERLEGLLEQPGYLNETVECLEALAEAYADDHSIMRFQFYNPEKALAQFQKFQKEAVPYQARDGFVWEKHGIFITQDEIDAFLQRGGPYSDGRLAVFAFFLQDKTKKEKETFIKKTYGTGGSSHALSGADDSDSWYDGKGIRLRRGDYERPDAEILLKWPKVAERIAFLIENGSYLKPADYSRMAVYEREQMAGRVAAFYHNLPMDIMRPWEGNPDMSGHLDDVVSLLNSPDGQEGLLRHMDEALASLPLDDENYGQRAGILADIHAYVEGTYTIFPEKKKEEARIVDGVQLSLFDFMAQKRSEEKQGKAEGPLEKAGKAEGPLEKAGQEIGDTGQAADGSSPGRTGRYGYGMGNFIYLDTNHLYRIKGVRHSHVYVEDMEHPDHKESMVSLESFDGRLSVCTELNRHWLIGGDPLKRDSRTIYKECLYTALTAVRNSPAYDVLRSRDTGEDMAYDIVREELDSLFEQNRGNAPAMVDAYENWENFKDWMAEDIFQRTYQDYLVDSRDAVALHQHDPSAPEWSRGMLVEAGHQEIVSFPDKAQKNVQETESTEEADPPEPDRVRGTSFIFEYDGFHFEAVGKLPENFDTKEAIKNTVSCNELGISDQGDRKYPYSHSSFYEASPDKTADIFRCVETGKNYIPGEHELFEYVGEFIPFLQQEKGTDIGEPETLGKAESILQPGEPTGEPKPAGPGLEEPEWNGQTAGETKIPQEGTDAVDSKIPQEGTDVVDSKIPQEELDSEEYGLIARRSRWMSSMKLQRRA